MDPQQRQLLERGYGTLHAASLGRTLLGGSLTGVFLGIASTEFAQVLAASPAGSSVYAATGSNLSIAAGRLSYTLGLHGPCVSYDTACSAALAACHAGLRALQFDECATGLTVGVSLMLAPGVGMSFSVAGMTSARGRSHTFDARADGYARSEACGGVALRRGATNATLEMTGSAVRQDGRSASLTAPNGQAQQGLLIAALADAGTSADALALNEAHGTGTALGDPIEAGSLVSAVLSSRSAPLAVSGVKSNIGHAEPAAGMTGLLKLALGLQQSAAAPNAQLRALNPHVGDTLQGVACSLPVHLAALAATRSANRRTGGVSSFGYSGTIVHAVLRHAGGDEAPAAVVYPLFFRRCSFPWRELAARINTARTSMYSAYWTPADPSADVSPGACLLLSRLGTTVTAQSSSASPRRRVVALLLVSGESVASSSHSTSFILSLSQQLIGLTTIARTLIFTSGSLAIGGASCKLPHSGAWGFARVLRLEHPALCTQSTDVSCGTSTAAVVGPMTEVEGACCEAVYCNSRLRECAMRANAALAHGPYAITGGLGGLGLRTATMLSEEGASSITLSSRSGRVATPGVDAQGYAAMRVTACDVADALDVRTLLARGAFLGVLHAAGVLHDKIVRSMSADAVDAVCAPKALAASHVHGSVTAAPIEALGLFSSVASTFGNVGQANYAAANAYLDALAVSRRRHGTLGSSLQIPAVSSAGMGATTFNTEQLDAMGAVSLDEFAACLSIALAPTRAAMSRTLAPLARGLLDGMAASVPVLAELQEQPDRQEQPGRDRQEQPGRETASQSSALAQALAPLAPEQRHAHAEAAVLRTMREVASGTMDEDTPLMEAGVDSLAATDVLNRLRALSGAPLPAALVFEQPTPRAIAAHVLGSLDAHDVSAELASPTSTLQSDAPLMVVQVPGLDGSVTKFQILNEWLVEFGIDIMTLDVLAYDAHTAMEWADLAATHVMQKHRTSRLCVMGYSLGCPLSFDLYLALVRAGSDVAAMVVLDFPLPDAPAALDEAAIDAQVTLVLASAVMDEPWSLPPGERVQLKRRLLDALPALEPRFASASRWASMLQQAGTVQGVIECPVLLVCSSDAHPLFGDVVRPDVIEASWSRLCSLRPSVHLLSGCHHLSIISDSALGIPVAHFLCSIAGVVCSVDRLQRAAARSEARRDDVAAVQDALKRQWRAHAGGGGAQAGA